MSRDLPPRAGLVLLALVTALLVFRLGATPLVGPDEPRYTRVAIEMHRAGEWVTPTLAGEPWLEKPPLFYWAAGAAFSLLGETEAAARVPSVLAAVLLVFATALVGARLHGSAAGLHAGFAAGLSLLPFAYGHAASMDMLLAATVTVAIGLVALRLLGIAGRLSIVFAAAFAGLAVLAKGPLGLLLPGLVVGGYVLATREWRWLRELVSPLAVAAFVVVAAPWYVAIFLDQGRHFLDVFILNHNVQRFTSTVHNHPGPFWYYVPVLLAGLFPWSGLTVPAVWRTSPRESRADLFVLLWLLLPLALLLPRRLEAARLHPAVRAPARDPRRPPRRPPRPGARHPRDRPLRPRGRARRPRARGARRRVTRRALPPRRAAVALGDPAGLLGGDRGLLLLAARRPRPVGRAAAAAYRRGGAAAARRRGRAADPRPPRVRPRALRRRHGPTGARVGRVAHGVDGRLLLQRREGARGRGRDADPGVRRGRADARAGGAVGEAAPRVDGLARGAHAHDRRATRTPCCGWRNGLSAAARPLREAATRRERASACGRSCRPWAGTSG